MKSSNSFKKNNTAMHMSWHLPYLNEIQNNPDWRTTVDKDREELIEASVQRGLECAKSWKTLIKDIRPNYDCYFDSPQSSYPINCRCICFESRKDGRSDLYDIAYICIDLLSGTPYYSYENTCSGPGGSLLTSYSQRVLTWPEFIKYASKVSQNVFDYYNGINAQNWQTYISAKMMSFKIF